MMQIQHKVAATAVLAAALLAGQDAMAGDIKVFAASFCQPKGTAPFGIEYNYSYSEGALWMEAPVITEEGVESPSGVDMTCPIVRDNQTNTNGFKFSAWVHDFWAEGNDDIVSCSAGIRPSNFGTRLDWETRSTPPGTAGPVKLDWGTSLSTGAADAIYFMDCFIPVYAGLGSYRTDEP